ncbi:MAG: RraA family protein [Candidatus Poribacteria bacterium]|nr:RraA family protein [Candidatus Poribacteria bacterium]
MRLIDKESIRAMTHLWEGDRFPDGRPRVPDDLLQRMKAISIEQAWGVLNGNDYKFQFAGDWMNLHPDQILVGRAVTCAFVPIRPDFNGAVSAQGEKEGRVGGQNSWVIDTLVRDDVIVVDLFGKVKDGTFAGDNLGNSIYAKTGTGMVIDGGIRDLDGIYELPDFATFVRGVDPTGIANVTLTGINIPIRIAEATVLPGDVVLGRRGGVIFIPPHFAQQVVEQGEEVALRDRFGHQRLREGKYTPGEIDRKWSEEIEADFAKWCEEEK